MGIERLTSSMLADARKQAHEIIKSAEETSENSIAEEKAKISLLLKSIEEEAMQLIKEQRKERLAWAALESKRINNEAKEEAISAVFDGIYSMFDEIRKKPDYKDFLKKALPQALDEIKSSISNPNSGISREVVVHCVKEDKQSVQGIAASAVKVQDDLDKGSGGGFMVETGDGTVRLNLTLAALLESKKEDLRKFIYLRMFGSEKPQKTENKPEKESGMKPKINAKTGKKSSRLNQPESEKR